MTGSRPRVTRADPHEFTDPYPMWKEARAECPVFWDDDLGYWQITRYADVADAVMDTDRLSSEGFFATSNVHPENEHLLPKGFEYAAPSLANADPPTHTRIRRLASEPFKARRVAKLKPDVEQIADDLIDGFVADGACDLVEQFTVPLSLLTIAKILGMPESDIHEMRRYSDERPASLNPNLTKEQQAAIFEHYGTYYDFLEAAIRRTRENPGDDLLSNIVARIDSEGGPGAAVLSEAELVSLVSTLIGAGNETTRYLIANMMLLLFRHPDQLKAVQSDPALASAAVEETLRHWSSVKGNMRLVKADVTYSGVTIPAGDLVQVCWGSAGRDESVFERPDEFDIFRPDSALHIAFSKGPHACLGAALARLEAVVALERLLARLPGLRLVREPSYPSEYVNAVQVTGAAKVEIAWDVLT